MPPRRQFSAAGLLMALGGAALFAWLVYRVGPGEIWSSFRQIGWGLVAIVAIAGLRFAARAQAWRLTIEPPAALGFRDAFAAVVSGDALGNITPLGPIVGEPAKAAFVRGRTALGPAVTALAIENVLYTLSAAAMIAAGTIALLFSVELPRAVRGVSEAAIAATLGIFAVALWLLWRRPAILSRSLGMIGSVLPRGAGRQRGGRLASEAGRHADAQGRVDRVRAVEQEIYTFAARRRAAMVPLIALELLFHVLGVLEVHVTLWLMLGSAPPLLTSFILETANRLITVVFKIVPMQVGVNEAGTALVTQLLGLGSTVGIMLGFVRKARILVWMLIGTALLVRHGLTPRAVLDAPDLHAGNTGR